MKNVQGTSKGYFKKCFDSISTEESMSFVYFKANNKLNRIHHTFKLLKVLVVK